MRQPMKARKVKGLQCRVFLVLLAAASVLAVNVEAQVLDSLNVYFDQAEDCFARGKYDQADNLYKRAQTFASVLNRNLYTYRYSVILERQANIKALRGQYAEAAEMMDQVIEHRRNINLGSAVVGAAFSVKAIYQFAQKKYDEAIQSALDAEKLYGEGVGKSDHFYAVNLSNLASYYSSRGASVDDFKNAVKYAELALKHLDSKSPEYAQTINNLVVYYSQAGDLKKSNDLSKKALQKGRKILGANNVAFADVLGRLSLRFANLKNYTQAIEYAKEASDIYALNPSASNSLNHAVLLANLGSFCKQAERFDLGVESLLQAQAMFISNNAQHTQDYINCTSNLAAIYRMQGNLEAAVELVNATETQLEQTDEKSNYLVYAKSLSEQAWLYAANGDYAKAIELEQKAQDVLQRNADSLNIGISLNDLAAHHFNQGNTDEAINLCRQAIGVLQRGNFRNTALGRALNNLSIFYYHKGSHAQTLYYAKQASENYEELGDTASSTYSKIVANLAMFYFLEGETQRAIELGQRSLRIQLSILGDNHPDLVISYYNLSNFYLKLHDVEQVRHYYDLALRLQTQHVKGNFSHLTTHGRELYWNTKSYIFRLAPTLAVLTDGDQTLVGDAYNAALFTKGILLNAEIDFKNFLFRSGQMDLLRQYEDLEATQKLLNEYYNSAQTDPEELQQLRRKTRVLERSIMRGCKEFGDFTSNLSISYSQVADSLPQGAAAVEFIDILTADNDRLYAALLLQHGQGQPQLVKLFSMKELHAEKYAGKSFEEALANPQGVNAIYDNPLVGHLVWNEIRKQLSADVHTIYFSPSGVFHQLGIEYLKINFETRINDLYTIHRLSSTKSIAQAKKQSVLRDAVVYGGLSYEMDREEMAMRHEQYAPSLMAMNNGSDVQNQRSLFSANATAIDSLMSRGMSFSYLEGTLEEARQVSSQLTEALIPTQLYVDTEGTEESFKALSGKGTSLVHIATHGFYFSDGDLQKDRKILRILGDDNSGAANHANSMSYSGLLMSGADNVLSGRRLPSNVDNGILTAKEISELDLRGLDLIVLSACQTGQGELREDGVYGLQRAFKKAGAQTLVMSLWSVDDRATQLMMSSFYAALTQGMSKRKAFVSAQQHLRDMGYEEPYYWAAFVMLDDGE